MMGESKFIVESWTPETPVVVTLSGGGNATHVLAGMSLGHLRNCLLVKSFRFFAESGQTSHSGKKIARPVRDRSLGSES